MADAKFIVVSIDNSSRMYLSKNYEALLDAIRYYCKTKLDANPKTEVVFFEMGEESFGLSLCPPTSDFQEIQDFLTSIDVDSGKLKFFRAINSAQKGFSGCPLKKKKRMLFFAGGPIDLDYRDVVDAGKKLYRSSIAVDVVNFYQGGCHDRTRIPKQSGSMELNAFVSAASYKNNSHIEHVKPEYDIHKVLSKSILKDTLSLSKYIYKKESSENDGDKFNRKRKMNEKMRKEESQSKKSRREYLDDDDCEKVVEKGHKKGKGGSSKNRGSDNKQGMSAYKLSAKLMKLHVEGKPEEALKLLEEAKACGISDEADD